MRDTEDTRGENRITSSIIGYVGGKKSSSRKKVMGRGH